MSAEEHQARARIMNEALMASIRKRAEDPDGVIGPCIGDYLKRLADQGSDEHPLFDLTRHLVGTFEVTLASIRGRMEAKHAGKPDAAAKIESSVRNSLMRSAGTNYQGLVSFAVARYLNSVHSCWYVQHPVPKEFGKSLAIRFSQGVLAEPAPDDPDAPPPPDDEPDDPEGASVDVDPDVDILVRNAAWNGDDGGNEPILLLSVKTSLADRAGSAARWKTYFDIVTRPCPHAGEEDCVYHHLGMSLAEDPHVDITHGIVTANIYKMNSDPYFTQYGELRTNQAKSNTFMFDLRFATRNGTEDLDGAPGWQPLSALPDWLDQEADRRGLPR